jgi:hypothetical protein
MSPRNTPVPESGQQLEDDEGDTVTNPACAANGKCIHHLIHSNWNAILVSKVEVIAMTSLFLSGRS